MQVIKPAINPWHCTRLSVIHRLVSDIHFLVFSRLRGSIGATQSMSQTSAMRKASTFQLVRLVMVSMITTDDSNSELTGWDSWEELQASLTRN